MRYFYFIVESVLFPLVMFNLIIAIISLTFEEARANKELTDMSELVEMLVDFGSFKRIFNCGRKRQE